MELEELISNNYKTFTEGEQFIANYILNHKKKIPDLSINELAAKCLSSKSSVLRFCQKLGFRGYTEFKSFAKWDLSARRDVNTFDNFNNYFTNRYNELIKYYLDLNLNDVVADIFKAENIYVLGTGKQQQIWLDVFKRCFLNLDKKIDVIEYGMNNQLYKSTIKRITENDLLIVKSHSGENPVLKDALSLPLTKEMKILAFTTRGDNWLASNSTHHLSLSPEYILEPFTTNSDYILIDIILYRYDNYLRRNGY